MTTQISTQYGNEIVTALIGVIVSNREYLSEIDGAIGDGDHGINMSKASPYVARPSRAKICRWHRLSTR